MMALRARTGWLMVGPLTWISLLAGCGGVEGMSRVNGTVTYNGQPLSQGEINFIPASPGIARGAYADLDDQGRYSLSTFEPGDGAYQGQYKVTITSRGPDKPIPPEKQGQMMEEDMQGTGDPLIPERYFTPMTSGLEANVESGSNVIDFDLTD